MKLQRVIKFAYRHSWRSHRFGFFKMLSVGMEVYS